MREQDLKRKLGVRIVGAQEDFIKIVAPPSMKSIFFALDSYLNSIADLCKDCNSSKTFEACARK